MEDGVLVVRPLKGGSKFALARRLIRGNDWAQKEILRRIRARAEVEIKAGKHNFSYAIASLPAPRSLGKNRNYALD
jgi:hypothetical protein